MNDFRNHLYFKQAVRVMAVALILGLLFSMTQIAVDFRNERRSIARTVTQVLETLRTPASQATFSLSQYLAEGVVDSLLKYQPIYSAALFTETGEVLAMRSRPRQSSRITWLAESLTEGEGEYSLPLYTVDGKSSLGKVVVRVDATLIADNFLTRAGLTLLFGFLKNIVLALAVSVVFYYTLSRPLSRLSRALAADPGESALNLNPAEYGDNEMGELLASANRFLENQVAARTEALQRQNTELKRLTAAVENSPVAVAMTDAAGSILYVNPRFERLRGDSSEGIKAPPIWHYIAEDVRGAILSSLQEKGGWQGELQGQSKDGSHYWQEVAVASIRSETGDSNDLVWVLEDISERKAAEQTLEVAQQELMRSEKLAALGALVAGIAHELNTPIGNSVLVASALEGQTKTFQERYAKPGGLSRAALEKYIQDVIQASEILVRNLDRAANLIGSFKQVAADQTSSQRRSFALSEMVSEVMQTLWPTLKSSAFTVEQHIPENIVLDSYPGPLGQVVMNLVNNAVLHGFDGRDSGVITIAAEAASEGWIRLAVKDNGVGIPSENLGRIFDPFFTTKLGVGGSGLGLCICHNIVTGVLGGQIRVESQIGVGTAFILTLPVTAAPVADSAL